MSIKPAVLVAEDEAFIRKMIASELSEDYDVLVARDGIDAVCTYERNMERVAAVVTDLEMPRLGGCMVVEWIHHIRPRLPIIVMSGSITNTELEELLQTRDVVFLAKPFDMPQLKALLGSVLEKEPRRAA
ncbi:MAG TPA: response regulator [Pyrinomonadaceae bacterium]|nr:response regulator [Pyrinomonadaceae bacterium]